MNVRILAAGAVIVATGAVAAGTPALASSARPADRSHARFCAGWQIFGNDPTFGHLTAVHELAQRARFADPVTMRDYRVFEDALLQGQPTRIIRRDSDKVWAACQADA